MSKNRLLRFILRPWITEAGLWAGFMFLVSGCWLLVFVLAGCGYTTRSLISKDYRSIYVEHFVNKIDITGDTSVARRYKLYHPLLENDITRSVIDRFILEGNLRVTSEEDADLCLRAELVDYRQDALRYTGTDYKDVEEYRASIYVNLSLWDNRSGSLLWEIDNFVGDTTYFTGKTTSSTGTAKSESAAITDAIEDLARRIVERVVEAW